MFDEKNFRQAGGSARENEVNGRRATRKNGSRLTSVLLVIVFWDRSKNLPLIYGYHYLATTHGYHLLVLPKS